MLIRIRHAPSEADLAQVGRVQAGADFRPFLAHLRR